MTRRPGRGAWMIAGLAASTIIAIGLVISEDTSQSRATATSGAYLAGGTDGAAKAFGGWRGTPVALINTFSSESWSVIEKPNGLSNKGRLFLSIGLLPSNDTTATLAQCAAGAYDARYRASAASIVAAGHRGSYVRLGWEFNSNDTAWSINPAGPRSRGVAQARNYAACLRSAVTAMRQVTGQRFVFVFSPSSGTTATQPDPRLAYPGDAYIDAVMPDQYDKWYKHGSATFGRRWKHLLTGGGRGLAYWSHFAETHHKAFGYSEWGTWASGTIQGGGGDDPRYIEAVADQLATIRSRGTPTVELYFNVTAHDADHLLWPTTTFPKSAARYAARF